MQRKMKRQEEWLITFSVMFQQSLTWKALTMYVKPETDKRKKKNSHIFYDYMYYGRFRHEGLCINIHVYRSFN